MLSDGCGAKVSVAGRCTRVAGIPQHKKGGLEAPPLNPLPKVKEAFRPPTLLRTVDAKKRRAPRRQKRPATRANLYSLLAVECESYRAVSGTSHSLVCRARETDGAGGNPTVSTKDYRPAQHSRIHDEQIRRRRRGRIQLIAPLAQKTFHQSKRGQP